MQYASRGKVLSWCGEGPDQPFSKYAVAFRLLNGTALKAVRIVANPNGRLASERLTDVDHSNDEDRNYEDPANLAVKHKRMT